MKVYEDVLVLEVYRPHTSIKGNVIRINAQAAEALEEVQRATGLPVSTIASRMICYAASRVEVVERRV